ncbi:nucleosome assembly protein 1-like 1 [Anastrepha obliqua]|uniref:nucleosome assembly protein 1-like 1 n=1 Tax=Anastrepha obliqua TaxID=95512 RepID=UPI0024091AE1|nr:nucleosome assembly protein 1-like 1 [Anastrepha obliqua]
MESIKMRNGPKNPIAKQNSITSAKKSVVKKLTEEENKAISELKKLYLETIKLDVELQKEIYNMEKSFEAKHTEIFEKRYKILDDFRRKTHGVSSSENNMSNFWLRVLKASYTEFISKKDEEILMYLTDIRAKLYNEPIVKFVIEFHFEPNAFFSNRILTKTYFLNCLPDVDDPLSYDGAEIYKCEGCKIDWKQSNSEKDKKAYTSFFDFFNPPTLPDDTEDPNYCDINAILQNDFELGFYLKERVIPKAVMFFTGEIADCQSTDSEPEDTDDENSDDDDEDEDSSTNELNDV